ncbi:MAG: pyruvate, water dikinase regulatory protein [Pseudomonadota bacterium]|nr:phosphoenolpyruvate synthase regulatory protein [Pseudomonadales bacterium]MDY6919940.1 pyruvate, water dikinase regulatory protein [Pseudomonadota bacterium]
MKRTVFFISDGTGITAETLGHSLLAQFDTIDFDQVTIPYVKDENKVREAVSRINKAAMEDEMLPVVFSTIINDGIRSELSQSKAFMLDIFSSFLKPLEGALGAESSYSVGKSHSIVDNKSYQVRIDSVHYALDNDDGARTRHYDSADVILIGVSRCGKTPTCLYLALQFGIRAANYPLTDDDLDDLNLPKPLRDHRQKLFGLSIDPERLAAIRTERKPNSRYASINQCESEVRGAEAIFNRFGIPFINSTHYSIEEISTKIIEASGIKRRLA